MSDHHPHIIKHGAAAIAIINVGDIQFRLSDDVTVPEDERAVAPTSFEQLRPFPTQCFHIALSGASVLVDACDYRLSFPPGSPYFRPGYQAPPGLLAQLTELGIRPEDVTHLVITHAHFDHYSGITMERDGQIIPCFPNARCFLGRADWEDPEMQQELRNPDSQASRTLGVVQQRGLLELVVGERELLPGIRIVPTPGESPGHQVVRVHSQEQTLYCLGDLYHDPIEVEHPGWMASWAAREATLRSRRELAGAALSEQALLTAAHIAGVGRLEQTASGVTWRTV
jgi:glyoxylase-like metal-dependent hydrolase (beta-lactamase superfamily II)